ncbi:MAG: hypothetical protein KGJ41_01610 [Rhodospirillales bacterium]|nr:hypothetical protein [Rhodospirillales bacterium]MDE2197691.1 hypothetical protein [Rhodospirillales bacterium]MDE2576066.1 hypothetical protein [Rhodospirillales bacterium]
MLRRVLLWLTGAGALLSLSQVLRGQSGAIAPAVISGLIWLGLMGERHRYKPASARPQGPGWEETGERFIDPQTGRLVTVFIRPATGERAYVDSDANANANTDANTGAGGKAG